MVSETQVFDMQDLQFADDEYETFCENLKKIQNKFLHEWINTFKENCERKVTEQYEAAIGECGDDIKKLQEQIEEQNSRSSQMTEVSEALRDLAELKIKLKQQQSDENKNLEDLIEKLETETKDVEAMETVTMTKREKIAKALLFFKERLGLEFKNLKGEEKIKVIFTKIDEYDQSRQFSFKTKIVESNYIITDCTPPIQELGTYVDELNTSNNFQKFIIRMRCAFKNTLIHCKENNPPCE